MGGMIFGHHKGDVQENVISNVLRGGSCLQVSWLFINSYFLFLVYFSYFLFVLCYFFFLLSSLLFALVVFNSRMRYMRYMRSMRFMRCQFITPILCSKCQHRSHITNASFMTPLYITIFYISIFLYYLL